MSVLGCRSIGEGQVYVAAPIFVKCPRCHRAVDVTNGAGVMQLVALARHDCPRINDVLADILNERQATR